MNTAAVLLYALTCCKCEVVCKFSIVYPSHFHYFYSYYYYYLCQIELIDCVI